MTYIKVLNKQIYYEFIDEEKISPDQQLLVFLHEGLGSILQWKDFPVKLCNELNLPGLLYDRYGYGCSEGLSEKRTAAYMHTEAFEFFPAILKELNINSELILIGHSDGGSIALLYASSFAARAVITIAAHIFVEDLSLQGIEEAKKAYLKGNLKKALKKYHFSNVDKMFEGWAETWLSEDFSSWNIEKEIKNIECKVLSLQGSNDQYGTHEQLLSIRSSIPENSKTIILEGSGHAPHLDNKNETIRIISDFIKELV